MVIVGIIIIAIFVGIVLWEYCYIASKTKGPMYVRYLDPGGNFRERPQVKPDELTNLSTICPICRTSFRIGAIYDVICPSCWRKIKARDRDFHPSYITDERDWRYLKAKKFANFWIIQYDYEHGDISADEASRLMHKLVPEDFGKIEKFPYREFRSFTATHYTFLNGGPDESCTACGHSIGFCTCHKDYENDLRTGGKSFAELKPELDQLRELNPKFILDKYYKKDGKIQVQLKKTNGFNVRDYVTFSDWSTIRFIINKSKHPEEYLEEDILAARAQYIELIKADLKILIKFHKALARGEKPQFPLLPSTNPASIHESTRVDKEETLNDKLMKQFYGAQ